MISTRPRFPNAVRAIAAKAMLCCLGLPAVAAEAAPPAHDAPAAAEAEQGPVAEITTAKVRAGRLTVQVQTYGILVPATGSTHTISLACDVVIDQWTLPVGAPVPATTVLGTAHLTAEAAALRSETLAAEAAAVEEARLTRARYDLKLATQVELLQATAAARAAEIRATAWRSRCPEERISFVTPVAGILLSCEAMAGRMIPGGTPIAVVATGEQEARLGIEPEEAQALPVGAPFSLALAFQPDTAIPAAPASMISAIIDPESRLLTVLVPVGKGRAAFGAPVTATAERPGPGGLLVPRASLARTEEGWCVFSIADGAAHRVPVTIIAESGGDAAISSPALQEGQEVAVVGSGVLSEGMQVRTAAADGKADTPGGVP